MQRPTGFVEQKFQRIAGIKAFIIFTLWTKGRGTGETGCPEQERLFERALLVRTESKLDLALLATEVCFQ